MTREEKLKLLWDAARKERTDEINRFWSRSLFFWGFIAATLIAVSEAIKDDSFYQYQVALLLLGTFLSLCMYLANRGSKKWQETWENRVVAIEEQLFPDTPMYGASHETVFETKECGKIKREHFSFSAGDYSVSKIATGISAVLFVGFSVTLLNHLFVPFFVIFEQHNIAISIVVTLILIAMRSFARRHFFSLGADSEDLSDNKYRAFAPKKITPSENTESTKKSF